MLRSLTRRTSNHSRTSRILLPAVAATSSNSGSGLLRTTHTLRLKYERLDDFYYQESFEALQRFEQAPNYPGAIKAATPGDTAMHFERYTTILEEGDKHYWRPVVDDPEPRRYVTIRVRFKEEVCAGDRFETHAHVIPVSVPVDSTIAYVAQAVKDFNDSPYLCLNSFTLALNGKSLAGAQTLAEAGVSERTVLDALDDVNDHRMHEDGVRPLDWYRDEMTPEVENTAPYAELKLRENTTIPMRSPKTFRMVGKPPLSQYGVSHGVQSKRVK